MGFVRLGIAVWWRGEMDGLRSEQNLSYFNTKRFLDLFLLHGTQRTFQNKFQISGFSSCFCILKASGMWRHGV
jgi:hypothetical protein